MARLYRKWKVFADNYLRLNMNGTWAYKATYGAEMDDNVAAACALKLLRKPHVEEYIQQQMQGLAMGKDENLARLASQARAEYANFVTTRGIDLKALIDAGKAHLIQEFSYDNNGRPQIKFYNAQTALVQIGKALGLYDEQDKSIRVVLDGWQDILDRIYGSNTNTDA